VELGFDIEPDDGPSGNLRHWRITGIPVEVCEVFSKRADEIAEHLAATGRHGYRPPASPPGPPAASNATQAPTN
jgi:hypothetical protein